MSLFRKIFRGSVSGGGSGGISSVVSDETLKGNGTSTSPLGLSNDVKDKINTTSTAVEGIEEKIPDSASSENQLATKADIKSDIEWDKSAAMPANIYPTMIAYNLGSLANGSYEFYLRSSNASDFGICRLTGHIILSVDDGIANGLNSYILNEETVPGQNAILQNEMRYVSVYRNSDGNIILLAYDASTYGTNLSYLPSSIENAFAISKIKNLDTNETFSAKEVRVFDTWNTGEYVDNLIGNVYCYPYVSAPNIPQTAAIFDMRTSASEPLVLEINNYFKDSPISVVQVSVDSLYGSFCVELHKINGKFYKKILANDGIYDVALYNASNGQQIPCISGLPQAADIRCNINYYGSSANDTLHLSLGSYSTKISEIPVLGGQSSVLKTADITADNIGTIVQHTGETKDGFINGRFYKATGNIIDVPEHVNIVPNTEGISLEDPNQYILNQIVNFVGDKRSAIVDVINSDGGVQVGPQPQGSGYWFYIDPNELSANGVVFSENVVEGSSFSYNYIAAHKSLQNPQWEEINVQTPGINDDAALYTMKSLSSLFVSSKAKLAKIYAEEKMPTTGAYTVLSLGWTYTDSENKPSLLAVELATGKMYFYQGSEENCNASAWKEFNFGGASSGGTDNNGLEGDYCSKYGIVDETKSGLPRIGTGNQVIIPAQLVLDVPGVAGLTTVGSQITHDLTATTNCELWLANGEVLEVLDMFWEEDEPEDGTSGYAGWWNGSEMKFKSNDTGNVFRPANAARVAKCIFTDGVLTRLCFTGCRLLNKQEFVPKYLPNTIDSSYVRVATFGGSYIEFRDYGISDISINGIHLSKFGIGSAIYKVPNVYTNKLNNGADINVPSTGGTMVVATPPAEDGNYVLKATVVDGVVTTTWVKEE